MTTQEKMHTIELTEYELARVLFVMSKVNGDIYYGRSITSLAFEKLNLDQMDVNALDSKREDLARETNLPLFIDYYPIQREWETFLGIGCKNKDLLDKITKTERELAELKRTL